MTKVLVTGASGFVGAALIRRLRDEPYLEVRAGSRSQQTSLPANVEHISTPNLTADADWASALAGIHCVVHTAARAHMMETGTEHTLSLYRRINVCGTLALAGQAASAGVTRFIYLSSAKVNGESTTLGQPYLETDAPAPEDQYAISKLEAEEGLRKIALESDMDVVIIRPPMIYGPNVKGNFLRLLTLISKGIPLPLGAVKNLRSYAAVGNVADFVFLCLNHPAAANETFFVSDGRDLSTVNLLKCLGDALDKPARLFSVPLLTLNFTSTLLGKRAEFRRLSGSLQFDIGKARRQLGWEPPISCDDALRSTADDFVNRKNRGPA